MDIIKLICLGLAILGAAVLAIPAAFYILGPPILYLLTLPWWGAGLSLLGAALGLWLVVGVVSYLLGLEQG